MNEFIRALANPDIPFLRYALIAGLMASISFGIIGSYVVARRITYIAGAIAHCVLGGIGAGLFFQYKLGFAWSSPFFGALVCSIFAALVIGLVSIHAKQREDTVIGALWAAGMAAGLLFLSRTPGYFDPMSYLFGNILLISKYDVIIVIALDIAVIAAGILFYNKFLSICFDEEFAKTRGISTNRYYLLLLCLTAVSVFLLMRIVGLVMVIALLTIPVAIAENFARRMWQVMVLSIILCMAFIASGLCISYTTDFPSGAVIVIIASISYLCVMAAKKIWRSRHFFKTSKNHPK
ncbi:MAG: metal ABC transporter permease [Candidatus Auribacterota bacterium]